MNTVRPEIVTIKSSANNIKNALPNEIDAVPNTMNVIRQITVKNKIPQKKNKTIILINSLHTSYE